MLKIKQIRAIRMKRFIFLSLGILFFSFVFIQHYAFAEVQNGLDLTISPSLLDLTANPGDTLKEKFRIRNNGTQTLDLSITVDKLDPHARNGEVVPVKPDPSDASTSWISFNSSTLSARPKEWLDVPFTITVPKTAAFGYYYAFRIGPTKPNTEEKTPVTKLIGQIVLPVLLNVQSLNAKAELTLVSFTTSNFVNEYLPVSFQTTFTNTGNVHIKPSGTIFIRMSDGTSESLDLNPQSGIILPGGKRTFMTDWTDGFLVRQVVMEDGQPKLDAKGKQMYQMSINWDRLTHFRIGKYTATVLAVYDNGQKDVPLEAITSFWVVPYTFLGISLAILIILGVTLRFVLAWYIRKEVRKHQQ